MIDAKLVGQIIQAYRENRGISQEILSGLAGLDRTHYSKIERGLRMSIEWKVETEFFVFPCYERPERPANSRLCMKARDETRHGKAFEGLLKRYFNK